MDQKEIKFTLRPVGNRILLKRLKDEDRMKCGLLIPDASKKKNEQCEIIGLGDNVNHIFKIKDIVLIEKYSPQEVNLYGEEYIIVKNEEVMAIVEK